MSWALFWTTLRLSQWALVTWGVILFLYGLLILLLFPAIQVSSGPVLEEYIRSLPEGLLKAMGLSAEVLDHIMTEEGFTLGGFLGTEYLTWWPVMVGIYTFIIGSGAVAREVERGTMGLLLSHPIPRYQVVISKFASFLAITGLLVVCTLAGIVAGLWLTDGELDLMRVFLAIVQGGMAVISIAAYSLLISCLIQDPRKAMALAGGTMAVLYIVNVIGPLLDSLLWVQKLSLFYYYRPLEIITEGHFALSSILVYLGITAVCFTAALVVFNRRKVVV